VTFAQEPGAAAPSESSDFQPETANSEASAPEAPPAPTEVELLKKRIAALEISEKEKEQKHLYLYADFENFKKRNIKERSDLIKFGWENIARDLLQVVDNLERALAHAPAQDQKEAGSQALRTGLEMVLNQFKQTLEKQGVQVVESVGKTFDPNFHEAVGQEPSDQPTGIITKEHTRGYTLHGRLLRPAHVLVSAGSAN
jgi:molecular chaperone GrpE